jgi:hypothetical protein
MFSHHDGLPDNDDDLAQCGQDRLPENTQRLYPLPALHSRLAVPFSAWVELDRLRAAFPDFSFAIASGWHGPVFEAWRDPAAGGLYAAITDDPRELWRELQSFGKPAADGTGSRLCSLKTPDPYRQRAR